MRASATIPKARHQRLEAKAARRRRRLKTGRRPRRITEADRETRDTAAAVMYRLFEPIYRASKVQEKRRDKEAAKRRKRRKAQEKRREIPSRNDPKPRGKFRVFRKR